jgi:hypothetical protein
MPAPTPAEFLLDQLLPSAKSGLLGASGPTAKRCFHIMNTSSNPAQRRHHCHSRRRDLAADQQSMDGLMRLPVDAGVSMPKWNCVIAPRKVYFGKRMLDRAQ